jgi:hypothetical protein
MPKASIIIPNYNHARYLGDAIRSVLDQEYREFEIIVVDDGSTDNSREVVEGFGDRVRYIWQENQGLSAARNTGIRAAKGEVVSFLDADDMYTPDFLSTLESVLEAVSDIEAAYCGFQFMDIEGQLLPQSELKAVPARQFYHVLLRGNFLAAHCMLVRKRTFEKVGLFDEGLRACEDWDMWLRISRQFKVVGVAKALVKYRVQPGSMSSDPIRMLNNRLTVLKRHLGPEPADSSQGMSTQRQAYGRAYLKAAVEYLQHRDVERVAAYLRKMAMICPGLLAELETYYELGCGDQPKGYRGDLTRLNVDKNAKYLLSMLDTIFADDAIPPGLKVMQATAYANAHYALGLLSYGCGNHTLARHHLLAALWNAPSCLVDWQLTSTLLKSFLGSRLISVIRQRRRVTGRIPNHWRAIT